MTDVLDFQLGRSSELLFDHHHHFLNERETPSSEMKFSGVGADYKNCWSFPELVDEGKGSVGSRTISEGEQLVSSSETTEEDDDYIAELTRQMTHYMLQDDDKHALKTSITNSEKNEESWGCVGWPSDSTTMWSPLESSSGSPEGPSEEPTPPVTPGKDDQALERKSLSYAAVLCKLDKLDTNKQGSLSGTTQVAEAKNPKQVVAFDQSQDSKINFKQSSKREDSTNRGRQPKINIAHDHPNFESCSQNYEKVGSCTNRVIRAHPPSVNLTPNPWLNNQQGPVNRVFLGGTGSGGARVRAPSCGTGVFFPCVIGNTSLSPKNKRGCAPVIIPAKVVQALKVHFDRVGDLPRPNPTNSFPIQKDSSKSNGGRTSTYGYRKRHSRGVPPPDMNNNNNEMGLPQEWTY